MRRLPFLIALAVAVLVAASRVQAQSATLAEEALWQVNLNVRQLFETPLGGVLNEIIKEKAPDGEKHINAFIEALGIDPRTAISQVVLYGDDFKKPNVTAVIDLGPSRGNIEGWLLAAPGYRSEALDDNTILHSFEVDEKDIPRVWCALPKKVSGDGYLLVAAFSADKARALAVEQTAFTQNNTLAENEFLSVTISDLSNAPLEINENDPGSGIIKALQAVSVTAANDSNKELLVTSDLTTDNAARAEQLQQLIVGTKAMAQLAVPKKDAKSEHMSKILNNITVEYTAGSTSLSTRFSIGYDELLQLIELKHKHRDPATASFDPGPVPSNAR